MKCEVLVVGGGAAGIAAACAAAESGANVMLVEAYGFLGGMATAAMVGTVCGLYYRGHPGPRYAVKGFARTFSERLAQQSGTQTHEFEQDLYFLPYRPEVFHQQADMQLKQADVQLLLHTHVSKVRHERGVIREIEALTPDRKITLQAGTVVDCSGESIVSILAGQDLHETTGYQAGALVFRVSGLPEMEAKVLGLNLIRWLKQGIHAGKIPADSDRLSIIPGTLNQGAGLLKLGMPKPLLTDLESRTDYERLGRSMVMAIVDYLRSHVSLLDSLSIQTIASQVGIRTGQRPIGLETLDADSLLGCMKPENGVAVGAWPMEKWGAGKKPKMIYFSTNDHYEIPAGALVSLGLSNLFFAGRGISATEDAIASARVIGTCLGTGYAAGMLAAAHAKGTPWQQTIKQIRSLQIPNQQ